MAWRGSGVRVPSAPPSAPPGRLGRMRAYPIRSRVPPAPRVKIAGADADCPDMERGDRGVLPGRVGRRAAPTRAELGVTAAALVGAAAATLLAVTLDTPGPAAVLVAGCAVPAVVRLRRAVVAALAGLLVSGLVACVLLVPAVEALPVSYTHLTLPTIYSV